MYTRFLKGLARDVLKNFRIRNKRRAFIILVPLVLLLIETPTIAHADGVVDAGIKFYQCATSPIQCALSAAGYAIFEFVGVFLAIVAWLFNIVIAKTVFGFADLFGNSAGLLGGWRVLRDICNIGLIFGFVYMGIATILDIHGYEIKKTLPRLIIFAVLLNFSLLASEAIIDTSNVFSAVLYQNSADNQNQLCGISDIGNNGGGGAGNTGCADQGIAGMIISNSKVNTVLSPSFQPKFGLTFYLGLTVVETILMVVLIAAAIMLIIRAVVLVFLMILSPIGFAGLAVPFLEPYAKRWWDTLLAQSFFAPVLLLLIFIGLKIGNSLPASISKSGSLADLFKAQPPATLDVLLIYVLVVGFMIAALMAAKQMGAYGASFATSAATKIVSYPFAFVGRNTVGRGAAAGRKGFESWVGNQNRTLLGSKALGRAVGGTLKATGAAEEISGGLKKVSGQKIGGFASFDDRKKETKDYAKETAHVAEKAHLEDELKRNALVVASATATADQKVEAANQLGAITQKMNDGDLAESKIVAQAMNGNAEAQAVLNTLSETMSADKFDHLMNNDKVDQPVKEAIKEARFHDITDAVASGMRAGSQKFIDRIESLDIKDIENNTDLITNPNRTIQDEDGKTVILKDAIIDALKDKQTQDLRTSKKISRAIQDAVKERRNDRFRDPKSAAIAVAKMRPEDIGKLEAKVLTKPHMAEFMTPRSLDVVKKEGNLKDEEHAELVANLHKALEGGNHKYQAQFAARISGDPIFAADWSFERKSPPQTATQAAPNPPTQTQPQAPVAPVAPGERDASGRMNMRGAATDRNINNRPRY
jgi:hypothetical protein